MGPAHSEISLLESKFAVLLIYSPTVNNLGGEMS